MTIKDWNIVFNEFCCYITGILVFFWLTTYYRQGHNLDLLKFTTKQVNSSCLALDWSQYEIKAKCVSQPKMAAKAWNDLASAINTHRTSQNPRRYRKMMQIIWVLLNTQERSFKIRCTFFLSGFPTWARDINLVTCWAASLRTWWFLVIPHTKIINKNNCLWNTGKIPPIRIAVLDKKSQAC